MWNLLRDEVFRPREGVRPLDLEVLELSKDRITLGGVPEIKTDHQIGGEWRKSGLWGLRWDEGYAQVGAILRIDEHQVVREFSPIMGTLKVGDRVRTDLWPYADDPGEALVSPLSRFPIPLPWESFPLI